MAAGVDPRDLEPLLLRSLCDRGPQLQPDNLVVTKTSKGYHAITLQQHQAASLQLASALERWGVRLGDCVATLMWNTGWHLQCYHAISCMGAVLHTLNLRLGPKDLGYIIQHAADRVIVVDADLLELLSKVEQSILDDVELFVCCGADGVPGQWVLPTNISSARAQDYHGFLATGTGSFQWPDVPETALHALCYTSGTTGNPKGAAYSHRSTYLVTMAASGADQVGFSGSDVVLPFVPMFHVLSWGIPFLALMLGSRMVFTSRWMDPDTLLDALADWEVRFTFGVPTVWQGVRASIQQRGVEQMRRALRVKRIICGGSAPPPDMMRWYRDQLDVEFQQGWGMTETNPLGCVGRRVAKFSDLSRSPEALFGNIAKAGIPIPGVQVRIADPDDLSRDVPRGEPGELLVRGPWIVGRYYKVDAPDKFHRGWLITGDVAKLDEEGAIIICDRSKDVIKSGGEWISSIDLENHISEMPDIAMVAVVAVPHPRWDERPVALVTLAQGADSEDLLARVTEHCLRAFAKFQVPDDVLVWDEIPLTSTGKLDKKLMRERLAAQGYVLPSVRVPESKL